MEDNEQSAKAGARASRRPGAVAQRMREELRHFDEDRRRRDEAERKKREELLRLVKEADARAKRQATNERLHNEKRLKFALGDVVLSHLRAVGVQNLAVDAKALEGLSEKDLALLDTFVARRQDDGNSASGDGRRGDAGNDGVDVLV